MFNWTVGDSNRDLRLELAGQKTINVHSKLASENNKIFTSV